MCVSSFYLKKLWYRKGSKYICYDLAVRHCLGSHIALSFSVEVCIAYFYYE